MASLTDNSRGIIHDDCSSIIVQATDVTVTKLFSALFTVGKYDCVCSWHTLTAKSIGKGEHTQDGSI